MEGYPTGRYLRTRYSQSRVSYGRLSNCREQSAKPARVFGSGVQHRAGTVAATGEPRGSLTPRMQLLLGKSQPFGQGGRRKIGVVH